MIIYLNYIMVAIIYIIGLDILGFWNEISSKVSKFITNGKVEKPIDFKPFSCSTCMGFWTNIVIMFINNDFSILNIFIITIIAFFTPTIKELLLKLEEVMIKLINLI